MDDPLEDDENALVKLTSLLVLGVGLAGLFLGYDWFWLAFVLGFAVLVPIVKVVTRALGIGTTPETSDHVPRSRTADEPDSKQDALDTLRNRYARGDLTEAEFERKVEALLDTETPESARKRVERGRGERERTRADARDRTDATFETDENA
ncbi:SHOCT domain-containing protein [Halorussus caseinilyticus]|uniref:SHOCT domain-containing protein n=1 Tax=Halorussus caseinilyticus TaxID=3034025 RepID=UPI0023E781C7|nr:SHOCT domain-containing protein [Halorussus sp. DT72]